VREGDFLEQNEMLMTGPASSAVVKLLDGTLCEMGPNTLLRFYKLNEKNKNGTDRIKLEFNQGHLKIKNGSENQTIQIAKQNVELQKSAEIVIEAPPLDKRAELKVIEGEVTVLETQVLAKKGELLNVQEEIKEADPSWILSDILPEKGARLTAEKDLLGILFSWKGSSGFKIEWSTTEDFKFPHLETIKKKISFSPGHYFWRAVEGKRTSKALDFWILPAVVYQESFLKTVKEGSRVTLKWKPIPSVKTYFVEVFEKQNIQNNKKIEVSATECEFTGLNPGEYEWRIQANHETLGLLQSSKNFGFKIKKSIEAPKPKGIKAVPDGHSESPQSSLSILKKLDLLASRLLDILIPSAVAAEKKPPLIWVEISWEKVKQASSYRLEVGSDKQFKETLARLDLKETSTVVGLPEREFYFWRVAALDEDGDIGAFSRPQKMEKKDLKIVERKVAAAPAEKPLPPVPFFTLREINAGWGTTYFMQGISGSSLQILSGGLSIGRMLLTAQGSLNHFHWTTNLFLQRYRFEGQDANIADLQSALSYWSIGAEVLVGRLPQLKPWQLVVGLKYRQEGDMSRADSEQVSLTSLPYIAAVVGYRYNPFLDFRGVELLGDLAPIGSRFGIGVLARGRWTWPVFKDWFIGGEASVYPHLRLAGAGSRFEGGVESQANILFGWREPDQEPTPPLLKEEKLGEKESLPH
jgi:hypothetical protein